MLKNGFRGLMGFLILSLILVSCSTDLHITMPEGPRGADGLSAYEIWKEGVNDGTIDWDKGLVEELHFFLYLKGNDGENGKDGVNGQDGKSAYDIWKEEVSNGLEDPHNQGKDWPKDKTTILNFWQYLAGKDGKNGQNGKDGEDGKDGNNGTNGSNGLSAYELWKKDVLSSGGLQHPYENSLWPTNEISMADFYRYLRGRDGRSAYEIWRDIIIDGSQTNPEDGKTGLPWGGGSSMNDYWEYLAGKAGAQGPQGIKGEKGEPGAKGADGIDGIDGLSAYALWKSIVDDNSQQNPIDGKTGLPWVGGNTEDDFWVYLKGKDGDDGKDGEDGIAPGDTIKIIMGVPNVIPQYTNQKYNEFVNIADGSVLYKVYDTTGCLAPDGTVVSNIPGLSPTISYTVTGGQGEFIIPKADLPKGQPAAARKGLAQVDLNDGVGFQPSASNVYVPNEIVTRIVVSPTVPSITGSMNLYLLTQRNVDSGTTNNWETIPAYLGVPQKNFVAAELSSSTDPSSFTSTVLLAEGRNVSARIDFCVPRYVKKSPYCTVPREWDGNDHYFNVKMNDILYGESPIAPFVVKMAPLQMPPRIKSLSYKAGPAPLVLLEEVKGELAIDEVDYSILYEFAVNQTDMGTYTLCEPKPSTNPDAHAILYTEFNFVDGLGTVHVESNNKDGSRTTMGSPNFLIGGPYIGSSIRVGSTNSTYFITQKEIGHLQLNGSNYECVGTESFPTFVLGSH